MGKAKYEYHYHINNLTEPDLKNVCDVINLTTIEQIEAFQNENFDKAVCKYILSFLKKQIPQGIWEHDAIDNNADSHIKASIIGPGQFIPIENKKLQLGRWQGIALAEFDGPRNREVIITILGN